MAMSNSAGKNKFKYNDIWDLILSKEDCRRDASINNAQDQVLITETRDRNKSRGFDNRAIFNDKSQSKSRS